MGQGLNIKVCQVVVCELGISLNQVWVIVVDISKVVNIFVMVVFIGSDFNGKVVQNVVVQICQCLIILVVILL